MFVSSTPATLSVDPWETVMRLLFSHEYKCSLRQHMMHSTRVARERVYQLLSVSDEESCTAPEVARMKSVQTAALHTT